MMEVPASSELFSYGSPFIWCGRAADDLWAVFCNYGLTHFGNELADGAAWYLKPYINEW